MKNICKESSISANTVENNGAEERFIQDYENKKHLLSEFYFEDYYADPDEYEIYISCDEAKRRLLEIENLYTKEQLWDFDSRFENEIRGDNPDMNPILDSFHIKNFDVTDYLSRRFGNYKFVNRKLGKIDTRFSLKRLNLTYYSTGVISEMGAMDSPTLIYDEDPDFLDNWECPISDTIEIRLNQKFTIDPILQMFIISRFRRHCHTLYVSVLDRCFVMDGKLSYRKKIDTFE